MQFKADVHRKKSFAGTKEPAVCDATDPIIEVNVLRKIASIKSEAAVQCAAAQPGNVNEEVGIVLYSKKRNDSVPVNTQSPGSP